MTHIIKMFLKIIQEKGLNKINAEVYEEQFGFRKIKRHQKDQTLFKIVDWKNM